MSLLVNPLATRVTPARLDAVVAVLEPRCELSVEQTAHRGHARELAAAAAGSADALIVFAGDGTYNEAINGAAGLLPFGFLPGGGTSVFARAIGMPRDPAAAALRVLDALERGPIGSIGLGRLNGRLFCSSAGIGLDAEVVRRVDARGRDRQGRRAGTGYFLLSLVEAIAATRARVPPQLEVEGVGRAAFAVVVNGQPYTYAGPLAVPLVAAADFAAGLDFVALRELSPACVVPLTVRTLRGTFARDRRVLSGHDLDALTIRCDRPLPVQADGEDLGDLSEIVFDAQRAALALLR